MLARGVAAYMHRHLAEPINLERVSRISRKTVFQIIRAFRREFGVTPHAYLVALRTHHAVGVLRNGGTAAEAAAAAGFADQSHFARHLKRRLGLRPREVRRNAAGATQGGARP